MLGRILGKVWRKLERALLPAPGAILPLRPPLVLPPDTTEQTLRSWLQTVHPAGAPADEMARYCGEDFERFVRTWHLTDGHQGECLEIGANPYFTTMLLRRFSPLRLTLVNFFGEHIAVPILPQQIHFENCGTADQLTVDTHHANIEKNRLPFADAAFDVVLFCEVLEHLLNDPWFALCEMHRVLKPGGTLIVTTPNVARLENIARLLAGENLYDPYSGYGPYGRHNREFTLGEVRRLLEHGGFRIETAFSADVHENRANLFHPATQIAPILRRREDLGQYLFVKAVRAGAPQAERPAWLFRSYRI